MKDKRTIALGLLIIITQLLVLYLLYFKKEKSIPVDYDKIVTEFIKVNKPYSEELRLLKEEIKNLKSAPPTIVKEYIKEKPIYNITRIVDSIIYISNDNGNEIPISEPFLTIEPNAHKLISMGIDRNNLEMTTLRIDGNIKTKEYLMDFDNYKYSYVDNELKYERIKNNPRRKLDLTKLYLQGGYDFIGNSLMTELNWQLDIAPRIRLDLDAGLLLDAPVDFQSSLKLGYRLFK